MMSRCKNKLVLLAGLAASAVVSPVLAQQTGQITGVVRAAVTQQPLSGAQVFVVGAQIGALTNAAGRYLIVGVPVGPKEVQVTLIGYSQGSAQVDVAPGQTAIADFAIGESAVTLDEIVVTGTAGQARRREVGNSISQLSEAAIEAAPVRSPQDLLSGRVAGISVLQNGGQPGAGGDIRIRGNNSISQGNRPLIYVDGVRIYSDQPPAHPNARQTISPINDIDPDDIARIEVVRGAAATTLYGTGASGGVIQIFTKRGLSGAARWDADVTMGFNNMGHVGPKADPTGVWLNKCRGPGNVALDGTVFEDVTCPKSGSWLKNGLVQRYSLGLRGGTEAMNYYLAGNYNDEQGVIVGGGGSTHGGVRGNFGYKPNPSLEITLNTNYTKSDVEWVPTGNNSDAFTASVMRGTSSKYVGAAGCAPGVFCIQNGVALSMTDNYTRGDHFITGLTVKHTLGESLTNRLTVGYDYNNLEQAEIFHFGYQRYPEGQMGLYEWRRSFTTVDYVGSFANDFAKNLSSTFSWGGQIFADDVRDTRLTSQNFAGPGDPTLVGGALRSITTDTKQRVVNAGFFLQELLGLNDRLFATLGMRVDGNSAFGKSFGLQAYPKLSLSYVVSDESFWPLDFMETLKLRMAVGSSGKAPGAFDAVRTWDPIAGKDGQPGFTPGQIGNPDLGPERTREVEGGLDASMLNGRIGLNATYYHQKTMDALVPVTYPPSNGFTSRQLENVGVLTNKGVELSLDLGLVTTPAVEWRVRGSYATNNTDAVDLGGEIINVATFARTQVREGHPVPSLFGLKITNPNAIADPITEADQFLGAAYPDRNISLSTSVTLSQGLTLEALGEWELGGHMLNAGGYQASRVGSYTLCYDVQRSIAAGNADQDGITAYQRAHCAVNGGAVAPQYDYWVEATDFFKLRTLSLSYRLPASLLPWNVDAATIRLAGRNLLTVTDYTGTDPELNDRYGAGDTLARRDYFSLPTYRTFELSMRVQF